MDNNDLVLSQRWLCGWPVCGQSSAASMMARKLVHRLYLTSFFLSRLRLLLLLLLLLSRAYETIKKSSTSWRACLNYPDEVTNLVTEASSYFNYEILKQTKPSIQIEANLKWECPLEIRGILLPLPDFRQPKLPTEKNWKKKVSFLLWGKGDWRRMTSPFQLLDTIISFWVLHCVHPTHLSTYILMWNEKRRKQMNSNFKFNYYYYFPPKPSNERTAH